MTGTELCAASSSRIASGPVRSPDRGDVPGEHERRVAQRLAARELELVGAQHHGVAAQLVDPHLERHARARRGLLEDQRDAAPGERAARTAARA